MNVVLFTNHTQLGWQKPECHEHRAQGVARVTRRHGNPSKKENRKKQARSTQSLSRPPSLGGTGMTPTDASVERHRNRADMISLQPQGKEESVSLTPRNFSLLQ